MIYLILDRTSKLLKIGYSNNPKIRKQSLQTGNGNKLELISTIEGNIFDEKLLHKKYSNLKFNNEWFIYNEEIVKEFLKSNVELLYTNIHNSVFSYCIAIEDKWAMKYLLWIFPKANEYGYIPHSKHIIDMFIADLKTANLKSIPSTKSVQDAISELVKQKVFLKHSYGNYQLNPNILWNSDTQKRIDNIKYLTIDEEKDLEPKISTNSIKQLK